MNPLIQLKKQTFGILVVLACFGLSPMAQALLLPPPDGGYPGGNTAEGLNALFFLTSGVGNTAIGLSTLFNNTTGSSNTATGTFALVGNSNGNANTANGFQALLSNTTGDRNTAVGSNDQTARGS